MRPVLLDIILGMTLFAAASLVAMTIHEGFKEPVLIIKQVTP